MSYTKVSKPARTSVPVRVSWAKQIFVPRAGEDGGDPKYGVTLLIAKNDPAQMAFLKQIHQDAKEALEEAWSDVATRPRIPIIGDTYSIIKDGDKTTDKNGVPYKVKNPEYVGHYFIRTANRNRPAVVDRNRQEILDPEKVYSGCTCKVNLNVYSYQGKTSKGITCGLNGVQFWADGERIGGGRPSLESMFDAAPPAAGTAGGDPFAGAPTPVEEDPFLKM